MDNVASELLDLIEEVDSTTSDLKKLSEWVVKISQYRVTLGERYADFKQRFDKDYSALKMEGVTNAEAETTCGASYPEVSRYKQLLENSLEVINALKVRRQALSDEMKYGLS